MWQPTDTIPNTTKSDQNFMRGNGHSIIVEGYVLYYSQLRDLKVKDVPECCSKHGSRQVHVVSRERIPLVSDDSITLIKKMGVGFGRKQRVALTG